MRLWSLHPKYLDSKGLVALWREGLLAQKVLQGQTRGYTHHPQLIRFRNAEDSMGAIGMYLKIVVDEADRRGYRFTRNKILKDIYPEKMSVTQGQLKYEFDHLVNKLKHRNPAWLDRLDVSESIAPHPMFKTVKGPVEDWEITRF